MNVSAKLIIIAFVFLTRVLFPKIITTDSITELEAEFNKADADTLVIFDCDDTLIHKTDSILSPQNREVLKRCMDRAIINHSLEAKHLNEIKYIVMQNNKQVLVNEKLPNLIFNLQTKGIKIRLLTSISEKSPANFQQNGE